MTDESQRALRHRAEQLVSLASHPAFPVLADEADKRRARMRAELIARMATEESALALQRLVDYERGFSAGMRYMTDHMPNGAARDLEKGTFAEPEDEERDYWSYD